MHEPTAETERELHRRPTGDVPGFGGTMLKILTDVIQGTAGLITGLLGYTPGTADTFRVGMAEALLLALKNCGDREAARLAAEMFLEGDSGRDRQAPAPFGYYRAFYIEERREEGGGWYVLEKRGGANVMPGGEWFGSTDAAALVIDLLYECGLFADGEFVEAALKYTAQQPNPA
jgi:hypothetical protein